MLGESTSTASQLGYVTGTVLMLCISGWIGAVIGRRQGRKLLGFLLGFLMPIVGWVIIGCLDTSGPVAPHGAGWWPDPYGRSEVRWYDGQQWTRDVANGGKQTVEAASPA